MFLQAHMEVAGGGVGGMQKSFKELVNVGLTRFSH